MNKEKAIFTTSSKLLGPICSLYSFRTRPEILFHGCKKFVSIAVPLGETSIEFYESLPTALEHEGITNYFLCGLWFIFFSSRMEIKFKNLSKQSHIRTLSKD